MKKQGILHKNFVLLLFFMAVFLLLTVPKTKVSAASTKLGAVKSFTAKPDRNDGGINITWKKVRYAKGYELYWKNSKKGNWVAYPIIFNKDNSTHHFYVGPVYDEPDNIYVALNKTYYFKIRAINGNDYGKFSTVKFTKAALVKPTVDQLSLKSKNSVSIYTNLNEFLDLDGFELYRATSKNGKYKKIKTSKKEIDPSNPEYEDIDDHYVDKKLAPGEYFYKARNYAIVDGKKVYSKFSRAKSIIVPKKIKITMNNWMKYYEPALSIYRGDEDDAIDPSRINYSYFLQLKSDYIWHDNDLTSIAKSSLTAKLECTINKREAIVDWNRRDITLGDIIPDEYGAFPYTTTKKGHMYPNLYLYSDHVSLVDRNPIVQTVESITMERIEGTLYLDKW